MTKKETFEKLLKIIKKERSQIIMEIICFLIIPIILIYTNTNISKLPVVIIILFTVISKIFDIVLLSVNKEIIDIQNEIIDTYKKSLEYKKQQYINQETKV